MFTINDDLSIYATRGDTVFFTVMAEENGASYCFEAGDVLRIKIFEKKNANKVVLEKSFPVTARTDRFTILLTEEDTKIGDVISKATDYWYEIELNPFTNPQTIIGYDEDGAKIFRLFPEGKDSEVPEVDPEDIPVVDNELDMTSTRPVQNQAISRAIVNLEAAYRVTKEDVTEKITNVINGLIVASSRIDNLASGATVNDAELIDIRVGLDGVRYTSAGTAVRGQLKNIKDSTVHMIDGLIPGDYNNLISHVVTPSIFAVMKSGGWLDIPDDMASAIIKVERYNADYLIQTALVPSSMREYVRIVDGKNKTVYKDWVMQTAKDQIGSNSVLYCIGDSITSGSYSNDDGSAVVGNNEEWSYPRRISKTYGCTAYNLGIAGAPITSFMEQANRVGSDATIVTITGGANDYHTGKELGEVGTNDMNTVCGVLGKVIETVATKAPRARIVLMSPFVVNADGSSLATQWSRKFRYSKFTYDELNAVFRGLADYYCVEYIDGTTGSPTNVFNVNTVQPDGVHPTKDYYATIANWLGSKLF